MLRRVRSSSLVWLALLAFAAAAVPRDAWDVHRHAPEAHGHVHAWGSSDADDAAWEELLAEVVAHGHRHEHATAHGDHPTHASSEAAASPGPALGLPSGESAHAHWQSPFQLATRAEAPALAPPARVAARPADALHDRAAQPRLACRTRAPPAVPSV